MEELSRIPEPLQWSEGMALAAQHFQQNDIYWHAVLRHQMFQLEPYYWGLIDLQLDTVALRTGKIVVKAVHAVMPDGLIVQYPAPDQPATLELDISKAQEIQDGQPLMVQLAVPVRGSGAASRTSLIQRYDSSAGALVFDENTGERQIPVHRLRPRLSLQPGEQLPAKYVALPLLKIRRDNGGQFVFADYHPPLLRLSASQFLDKAGLQHRCVDLAAAIRRKARELLGSTDDTGPSITNSYQRGVVRQLVAALPEFELLARTAATHPFRCYAALSQLVGHIAGISTNPIPLLLDVYAHDDVATGFLKALDHVATVIEKLSAAYAAMLFERPRQNLFTCELPSGMRADRLVIEALPGKQQSATAVGQWLQQARIGSESMIPILRQRRIPGGKVEELNAKQLEPLGVQPGNFYAIANQAVQQDDKLIPAIQKGSPLHIEGPDNAAAPASIVLYVQNPKRSVGYDVNRVDNATARGEGHG